MTAIYFTAECVDRRGVKHTRGGMNFRSVHDHALKMCEVLKAEVWLFEGADAERQDKLRAKYSPSYCGAKVQHYK